MAAATLPPVCRIDTAANWADPANVVADIAIGAQTPIPAVRARTPKETPKAITAMPIGTLRRAPSRSRVSMRLHHRDHPPLLERCAAGLEGVGGALGPAGLGLDPRLRLDEERPHLGEQRARRGALALERLDPCEPREHCRRFVHPANLARKVVRVCAGSVPKVRQRAQPRAERRELRSASERARGR